MSDMGADIRVFSPPPNSKLLWYYFFPLFFPSLLIFFIYPLLHNRKVQGLEWLSTAHYDPTEDIIYGPTSKYSFVPNSIGNGTEWQLYSATMDLITYPWDPRANIMLRAGSTRIYHFGGVCHLLLSSLSSLLLFRFSRFHLSIFSF
jgi:hypothetical protein